MPFIPGGKHAEVAAVAPQGDGGEILAAEGPEKRGHPRVRPGGPAPRLYFTQGQPPR